MTPFGASEKESKLERASGSVQASSRAIFPSIVVAVRG